MITSTSSIKVIHMIEECRHFGAVKDFLCKLPTDWWSLGKSFFLTVKLLLSWCICFNGKASPPMIFTLEQLFPLLFILLAQY